MGYTLCSSSSTEEPEIKPKRPIKSTNEANPKALKTDQTDNEVKLDKNFFNNLISKKRNNVYSCIAKSNNLETMQFRDTFRGTSRNRDLAKSNSLDKRQSKDYFDSLKVVTQADTFKIKNLENKTDKYINDNIKTQADLSKQKDYKDMPGEDIYGICNTKTSDNYVAKDSPDTKYKHTKRTIYENTDHKNYERESRKKRLSTKNDIYKNIEMQKDKNIEMQKDKNKRYFDKKELFQNKSEQITKRMHQNNTGQLRQKTPPKGVHFKSVIDSNTQDIRKDNMRYFKSLQSEFNHTYNFALSYATNMFLDGSFIGPNDLPSVHDFARNSPIKNSLAYLRSCVAKSHPFLHTRIFFSSFYNPGVVKQIKSMEFEDVECVINNRKDLLEVECEVMHVLEVLESFFNASGLCCTKRDIYEYFREKQQAIVTFGNTEKDDNNIFIEVRRDENIITNNLIDNDKQDINIIENNTIKKINDLEYNNLEGYENQLQESDEIKEITKHDEKHDLSKKTNSVVK